MALDNQPIALDSNTPTQPDPISLDTGTQNYLLSPDTVASRSFKAAYGLDSTPAKQDPAALQQAIGTGQEDAARTQAASTLSADASNKRTAALTTQIAQQQGPLNPEDMKWMTQQSAFNTYVDPRSVFETNYANTYVNELDNYAQKTDSANPWNVMTQATQMYPMINTDASAIRYFGSVTMAQHEYLVTKAQNMQSVVDNQSTTGKGADFLKLAFPIFNPYYELKMRGNVPGVDFLDGFLGSNLDTQRTALMNMPMDKFMDTIDQISDHFSKTNPQAGLAFISSMIGQSSSDKLLNNINTIGNLADVPSVFAIGRLVFNKASVAYSTRKAVADLYRANAVSPETTRASVLASAGDIPGASIEKAQNVTLSHLQGAADITKEGLDQLPRFMRTDMANIAADPGNLTTTQTNAILEQYKAAEARIIGTLGDMTRPERIPLENANRDIITAIQKTTFDRYPGMSNAIIDMSDPVREPLSTGYFVSARVGKGAGEFFGTEEEALNYARYHGINIKLSDEQVATLDARINALKDDIKAGPSMDDDTAGLNHYYGLDKQLKDLENQRTEGTKGPGASVGKGSKDLPPVKDGYVRFYHGGDNPTSGGGRWVSPDLNYAANYRPGQSVHYVDIPENSPLLKKSFDDTGTSQKAPYVSFEAPEEFAKKMKPVFIDQSVGQSMPGHNGGPPLEPVVGQQGLGHYIQVTKPLNETDRVIRDFIYDPNRATSLSPKSISDHLPVVNYLRTAEDTTSVEQRLNRKGAVYPQALLFKAAHEEARLVEKSLGMFRRDESRAFRKTLEYNQTTPSPYPEDNGIPGFYWKNQGELSDFYLRTFDRQPTFRESQAYWANKRWGEMDLMLRETSLFRNKSRLGVETHQIVLPDGEGGLTRSPKFDGLIHKKMPGGSDNILIMGDTAADSKVHSLQKMTIKEKADYTKLVQEGQYKVIEPYDPEQKPFSGYVPDGDNYIKYVLAKNVETSPLTWQQLPYRGGGHLTPDYSHYVKQAIVNTEKVDGVVKHRYQGDRTVAPVVFRAMGNDFSDKMNQVRMLIKANRLDEAEALTAKHLPYEWKDLQAKFRTTVDADGLPHPPVFSLDEPFMTVPKNKSIAQMSKDLEEGVGRPYRVARGGTFQDDTKNGMARNFQLEFTGKRDAQELQTLENTGTLANPVYNFQPAQMIDPIKIMNRGLGSIIHSTFMDDYKISAIEAWLREAQPHLKALDSELRTSPFYHFKTATDDAFLSGTKPEVKRALMAQHFKIDQLVGTPSVMDTFLHSAAQSLADAAYNKFGPGKIALTPAWLLPKLTKPAEFLRAVTYHAYLGLFAIPQMFVQAASYVNMFALAPRLAVTGTLGAFLHGLTRLNAHPNILEALDKIASNMGHLMPGLPKWRPGEFLEARTEMMKTGFSTVAGEYGPLDSLASTKIIQGTAGKFLSWGTKPFQMGEAATRYGAWFMAFKDFRDLNPTGAISNADRLKILDKADLFYGNMSTASNSALNSGMISLPTQFFNYTNHLAEQFFSKRIGETTMERNLTRARMIAVNGAMFGMPMAAGISGLPLGDYLRQAMMDNGFFGQTKPYSVDTANQTGKPTDWIEHFLMEGLPATMLSMATGNNYNIGPRYGLGGFQALRDLAQDASFWKILGGASGTLAMNTWNNKDGMVQAISAMVRGDAKQFPLKAQDFTDIVREAQLVNKSTGLIVALNTGKWVNKNSEYLMDVSPMNAIMMTAFGLNPQEQVDIFNMASNLKAQRDAQAYTMKRFQQEWNRGLIANANKDPAGADAFFARAMGWTIAGNLPVDMVSSVISRSLQGRESLIDRMAWERYITNAPDDKKQAFRELYGNIHHYIQTQGKQ